MKALRIVFLGSAPEWSSSYIRSFLLGKYLVERGHMVSLIATSRKATLNANRKIVDGVNVFLLPSLVASNTSLFFNWLSKASTVFVQTPLNSILEATFDFDILHSFDVMFPQNATPTLLSRISCFLRIHDQKIFVDWDDWWGGGMITQHARVYAHGGIWSLIDPVVTFLEEKVPRYADAVTVSAQTLRQRALRVGVKPENLFVLPNGADVDSIKPLDICDARTKLGLPMNKIIYTQAGILDQESFELLILAHKKVVKSYPDALLLLVGKIHTKQLDFLKSLNMTRKVIYVGWQPDDNFRLYLGASDVFLLPMRDSAYDRARWPLRLGDYLAAGRPTVATALPEIKKVVSECGLLAKPDDPEDFANKLLEVIRDPDLREKMGKRARELAERKYSWQILAKQLEKIYTHARA